MTRVKHNIKNYKSMHIERILLTRTCRNNLLSSETTYSLFFVNKLFKLILHLKKKKNLLILNKYYSNEYDEHGLR
ncbi:hypothetical protein Hanom_Chr11g01039281 [Helianthus anomalus]